jgi:transaldolase
MSALLELTRHGQSIWLDNLSRTHLREGGLREMIQSDGVSGVTSNPSIFHKAVAESAGYADDLAWQRANELVRERRYEALVIADVQAACDLLLPVFDKSRGDDGYVSLEVSPRLAHDESATIAAAKRLAQAVGRSNLLIKVPGTPQGLSAFERLIAEGVSVNVTLLFSLHQVVRTFEAYTRGLKARLKQGGEADNIKAVASIFLSRVDTLVDKKLEAIGTAQALALRGKTAVAMAKLAYQRYLETFHGDRFGDLAQAGCRRQYLLWASTGTKNPQYSDLLYVQPLIGGETINTMPDATLDAFRDHGVAAATLEQGVDEAQQHHLQIEQIGIDMAAVGDELQAQGVRLFDESYSKLLELVA